jgi:hypothetical protein
VIGLLLLAFILLQRLVFARGDAAGGRSPVAAVRAPLRRRRQA